MNYTLETFKLDGFTITLDEDNYLVGCTKPDFIIKLYKNLKKYSKDIVYYKFETREIFRFYLGDSKYTINMDIFDEYSLTDKQLNFFNFTCYDMDYTDILK